MEDAPAKQSQLRRSFKFEVSSVKQEVPSLEPCETKPKGGCQ